jgi:hypothetical protein
MILVMASIAEIGVLKYDTYIESVLDSLGENHANPTSASVKIAKRYCTNNIFHYTSARECARPSDPGVCR